VAAFDACVSISSDNKKSGISGSIIVFDAAIGALYTDDATSAL
jgi:hypothetical protein